MFRYLIISWLVVFVYVRFLRIRDPNLLGRALVPFGGLPVLGNVEAPLELEMLLLVVIHEARDGVVVAAGEHAAGGLLLLDCGGVNGWI